MSRKQQRVQVDLDPGGIRRLPAEEIAAILRGADNLIGSGGRTLLSKILKGSKDKKIFELGLDALPVYGYYRDLSIEEILQRIDWVILNGLLKIEYNDRLPMLVYTPYGWEIEKETFTNELLGELDKLLDSGAQSYDMSFLVDRNRELITLLLDKIRQRRDPRFIPLLDSWAAVDYKKVRQMIEGVIRSLQGAGQP